MASTHVNEGMKGKQRRNLMAVLLGLILVTATVITLVVSGKSHSTKSQTPPTDLTGIVDESFGEANTQSAMTEQQMELEHLKTQLSELKKTLEDNTKAQSQQASDLEVLVKAKEGRAQSNPTQLAMNEAPINKPASSDAETPWKQAFSQAQAQFNQGTSMASQTFRPIPKVHSVQFRYVSQHPHHEQDNHLNPAHYVPSGTFVRAVVLGGADADASVNGQSKNNGVMLFKLLQPGTLPNGQHSRLQGCFVTASSYGDISSERAYVVLDKLSCAQPNQPIIDKAVTGWAFFGGKVGIKGQPLMRDNKVMQWAGISGAMSGIAAAAQYSQSVQSISALGSATVVPSSNIAPYSAYGGASKAADVLSNYYVKRAEQYHPVIQVGSGNMVTIVFKDGFYLEPDEAILQQGRRSIDARRADALKDITQDDSEAVNFEVPQSVLSKIDRTYTTHSAQEMN
jgi:conjugal transfer pilus assembly protein TraB